MTCHRCRYAHEIAALAERPDEAERARLLAICTKCTLGEEGRASGNVSLDAMTDGSADKFLDVAPHAATSYTFDPGEIDEETPEPEHARPTNLPGADEDTLRRMIATAVQLHPLAFVVVLNRARRSGKSAAQAVRDFAADVRRLKGDKRQNLRATFHAKWKSMVGKIPELAAIRAAIVRKAANG